MKTVLKTHLVFSPTYSQTAWILALFSLLFSSCSRVSFISPLHPYDFSILDNKQQWAIAHLPTLENEYYATNDESIKSVRRARVVFTLMDLVDMYQYKFNSEFYGRSAAFTSAGEIAAAGLSATAAVVSPLGTSQLLAALSTATLGSTAILSKNFVQNRALDLLVDRMEALRKDVRARIVKNMKDTTDTYPLVQALLDVQEYSRSGTIFAAIRAINKDNAQAQEEANKSLDKAEEKPKAQ